MPEADNERLIAKITAMHRERMLVLLALSGIVDKRDIGSIAAEFAGDSRPRAIGERLHKGE
jgi:hypothetical protein